MSKQWSKEILSISDTFAKLYPFKCRNIISFQTVSTYMLWLWQPKLFVIVIIVIVIVISYLLWWLFNCRTRLTRYNRPDPSISWLWMRSMWIRKQDIPFISCNSTWNVHIKWRVRSWIYTFYPFIPFCACWTLYASRHTPCTGYISLLRGPCNRLSSLDLDLDLLCSLDFDLPVERILCTFHCKVPTEKLFWIIIWEMNFQ